MSTTKPPPPPTGLEAETPTHPQRSGQCPRHPGDPSCWLQTLCNYSHFSNTFWFIILKSSIFQYYTPTSRPPRIEGFRVHLSLVGETCPRLCRAETESTHRVAQRTLANSSQEMLHILHRVTGWRDSFRPRSSHLPPLGVSPSRAVGSALGF